MQFLELLNLANKGYNGWLVEFYEFNIEEPEDLIVSGGDTLGLFIVSELTSTFQAGADDQDQIFEAIRAMNVAKTELESVIKALKGGSGTNCSPSTPPGFQEVNGGTAP